MLRVKTQEERIFSNRLPLGHYIFYLIVLMGRFSAQLFSAAADTLVWNFATGLFLTAGVVSFLGFLFSSLSFRKNRVAEYAKTIIPIYGGLQLRYDIFLLLPVFGISQLLVHAEHISPQVYDNLIAPTAALISTYLVHLQLFLSMNRMSKRYLQHSNHAPKSLEPLSQ